MGTALSDRLIHLNVRAEARRLARRATPLPQGLHPAVITFIRTRPDLLETTEDAIRRGQMIACTPRSWTRVSTILHAVPDRRLRDIMIAGTVGEAAAAEFILIAEEIAATVQVAEMLQAGPRARLALYPATMHGLTALVYGLIAVADATTLPGVIEIMAEIRHLARLRPEPAFARLPLAELATYGFETPDPQGAGRRPATRPSCTSPAYAGYAAERKAAGLE